MSEKPSFLQYGKFKTFLIINISYFMRLSLDIFVFDLKPLSVKDKDARENFDKVYEKLHSDKSEKIGLHCLLEALIQSFDKSFLPNSDNSKAISFADSKSFQISDNRNIISGRFYGGNTGIKSEVYKTTDATKLTHTIENDEVTAVQFFFEIWFPKRFNKGVLIVQRYSNSTCLGLFRKRLSDFFKEIGYKLNTYKFVPDSHRKKFIDDCTIVSVDIKQKNDIDSGIENCDILKTGRIIKTIKNIAVKVSELTADKAYKRKLKDDIAKYDNSYNEQSDTLIFHYIDSKGQRAQSTLDGLDCLLPSVNLDVNCIDSNNAPKWDEISAVANRFLEAIKNDLQYN